MNATEAHDCRVSIPPAFEFRRTSRLKVMGLPLYEIWYGRDPTNPRRAATAKGVIAIGIKAAGIIAVGHVAFGIFSFGIFSVGLISFGVLVAGALATGVVNV